MSDFHPSDPGWEPLDDPKTFAQLQPSGWRAEHSKGVALKSRALPFYPKHRLVMAKSAAWTPRSAFLYWLVGEQGVYHLNGTSPPIHEVNAKSGQKLTADVVVPYLKFFCFFVRGEEGPFLIIDSLDCPYLPKIMRAPNEEGEETHTEHELLASRYQSVRTFGTEEDGTFRVSATLFYSNAIFVADLLVQPSGMIEMKSDAPVMADLPVKIDAPLAIDAEFAP